MDGSSESWEVASQEDLVILPGKTRRPRVPYRTVKLRMLHQILYSIELMRKTRRYPIASELNEYEVLRQLKEQHAGLQSATFRGFYRGMGGEPVSDYDAQNAGGSSLETNINLFIGLIHNGIDARLYFVVGDRVDTFIEYRLGHKIVEHKGLYDGNVFSFDRNGRVRDQTVLFSRKQSHFRIYRSILRFLEAALEKDQASAGKSQSAGARDEKPPHGRVPAPLGVKEKGEASPNIWTELDDQRLSKVPVHLKRLKIHPLYVTESLCRRNEIIYPKGRVCGHINGEKVYLRKNLQKIRTEKGWYYDGRVVEHSSDRVCGTPLESTARPYRIVNGRRLYAEFQTRPLSVAGLSGWPMDAFHANFIPRDCVYIDACSDVCRALNIKHSDCVVGFRYRERVVRGFFINKKDCAAVNDALREQTHYQELARFNQKYEAAIRDWRILIKKMELYLKIRENIGMD